MAPDNLLEQLPGIAGLTPRAQTMLTTERGAVEVGDRCSRDDFRTCITNRGFVAHSAIWNVMAAFGGLRCRWFSVRPTWFVSRYSSPPIDPEFVPLGFAHTLITRNELVEIFLGPNGIVYQRGVGPWRQPGIQ